MALFVETKKQNFLYFYRVCGMSIQIFVYAVTDAEYTHLLGPLACVVEVFKLSHYWTRF